MGGPKPVVLDIDGFFRADVWSLRRINLHFLKQTKNVS